MKHITVLGTHIEADENFGVVRRNNPYGGLLIDAERKARQLIEANGYAFHSQNEMSPEDADIILCVDLSHELDMRIRNLHGKSRNILLCEEAPLHSNYTLQEPQNTYAQAIWERIVTWNRAYEAEHILHYDLPFCFSGVHTPPAVPKNSAGIAFVSNAPDERKGLVLRKNHLCQALKKKGIVELLQYGGKAAGGIADTAWIGNLAGKAFALAIEDTWVAGYVSELLPACIAAGVPAIYWGDAANAERRYPGTFMPMEELSLDAFNAARIKLEEQRDFVNGNIRKCQAGIGKWSSSFIDALATAIS